MASFNGTAMAAGDTLWFNSVLKANGLSSTASTTIQFVNQTITVNGTSYQAPNAMITFVPGATSATTVFNSATNTWETSVPSSGLSGNQFLSGFALPLPNGLPGGIKNVTWSGFFSAPAGVSLAWKWAAAAYTSFSTDYNALGVKPVDDNHVMLTGLTQNSDHAGTPENDKRFVTGGATGGGGSNYTGGYSGTQSGAFQLADGATSDFVSSTANWTLNGMETVAVQDDTGAGLDPNELNQIGEAMAYLKDALGSFGVSLTWAAPGADADVHVHFASSTPQGGASDGVLGFTTATNDVYLVTTGWNFYTGDDPTQIGSDQFDFLTLATHELAHTVGLGESFDPASVMYEYLAPGKARRTFTETNLSLINTDSDRYMKAAPQEQGQAGSGAAAGSNAANVPGMIGANNTNVPLGAFTPPTQSGSPLSAVDQLFADLAGLLSNVGHAYQLELSSLSAQWRSINALAQQRLDALLSMQAGAMGMSKDTLMHDLFFAGLSSSDEV